MPIYTSDKNVKKLFLDVVEDWRRERKEGRGIYIFKWFKVCLQSFTNIYIHVFAKYY